MAEEVAVEVEDEAAGGLSHCGTSSQSNPNYDQNYWQTPEVEGEDQQTQTHHLHLLRELGEEEPSDLCHLHLHQQLLLKDV